MTSTDPQNTTEKTIQFESIVEIDANFFGILQSRFWVDPPVQHPNPSPTWKHFVSEIGDDSDGGSILRPCRGALYAEAWGMGKMFVLTRKLGSSEKIQGTFGTGVWGVWCFSGDRWGSIDSIAMWVHLPNWRFQISKEHLVHLIMVSCSLMEVHPSVLCIFAKGTTRILGLPKCDFEFEIWGYPKDLKHLKIPWRKSWSTPPLPLDSLLWSGFHHIYSNLMNPFLVQCPHPCFFLKVFSLPKPAFPLSQKIHPGRCLWVKATWRFRWKHIVETIAILWSTHVPVPRRVVGFQPGGAGLVVFPPFLPAGEVSGVS